MKIKDASYFPLLLRLTENTEIARTKADVKRW